jgi:hypothetical protein
MNPSTIDNAEATILSRVIGPDRPSLSEAVAKELLAWGFSDADKQHMSELAAKARRGELTNEEAVEAAAYERVSSFLGLVKSKARRSLQSHPGA